LGKVESELREHAVVLHRDGVVAISDFYSDEQFQAIRKAYEDVYSKWSVKEETKVKSSKNFPDYFKHIAEFVDDDRSEILHKYFASDSRILKIISSVVHRKISWYANPFFWTLVRKANAPDNVSSMHTVTYFHADVPYPTIKVFLYLNDVDQTNAAFKYARGSHKMTLKRLWFEYKLSVKKHFGKKPKLTAEGVAELGFEASSIIGKANTLIITNNMGFHARGDFSTVSARETAQMDFRFLESWRNILSSKTVA